MGSCIRRTFVTVIGVAAVSVLVWINSGVNLARDWQVNDYVQHNVTQLAYDTFHRISALVVDVVGNAVDNTKRLTSLSQSEPLLVMYWTTGHWKKDWKWGEDDTPLASCPELVGQCEFTSNHSRLNESDILLFHMRDPITLPPHRRPHQKWVFSLQESPVHTYINVARFQGLFNLTMTYARSAEVPWMYGHCEPLSPTAQSTYNATVNYAAGKKYLVAWFVSHCRTASRRETYAEALQEHVNVHRYGCGGGHKCPKGNVARCYGRLLNDDYKFYLSFENSLCRDYMTEKLWRILQINTVPIILGYANNTDLLPVHSYIDVRDFASPRHLADHLKLLDANDTLYNEYFRWREAYTCREGDTRAAQGRTACILCRHALSARGRREVVTDLVAEWGRKQNCGGPKGYYRGMDKYFVKPSRNQ
ncbi:Alpha-(1,3)-fucosyltransferase C [Lamellibrachia satsuma]|nr:Alpha-(1,3)-fucosyltransferase C [Lamellibrachia satsuma]